MPRRQDYSSLPQVPSAKAQYDRFFETHVHTGVTDGLLQQVDAKTVADFSAGKTSEIAGVNFSPSARQALQQGAADMAAFADRVGADKLLFTPEGSWVVPPKMRANSPEYRRYLHQDAKNAPVAGTAAITLAQNEPIPVYKDGQQIGGFETGDQHGFLTIVDRRTGQKLEAQQTFLENSDDPAMRPNIVGINPDARKPMAEVQRITKDPKTKLDGVGMLEGKNTADVMYGCEVIPDIDKAFNWNNGTRGANFNYVPLAAIEFKLTPQQLDVLKFDRELAGRESAVKAAPESKGRQNEPGYVPATKPSFYPDGTARYVTAHETKTKEGTETEFRNAHEAMPGGLPKGAIRVMEYDTVVPATDMQVVRPYNNLGGSKLCSAGSNCFKAVCDMLDGVAAGGMDKTVQQTIGAEQINEAALQRMLLRHSVGGETRKVAMQGAVDANVTVHTHKTDAGGSYAFYDFAQMKRAAVLSLGKDEGVYPASSIPGKAIAEIGKQREQAATDGQRPPESQLTLFPVGAIGGYLAQAHDTLYGAAPGVRVPQAAGSNQSRRGMMSP